MPIITAKLQEKLEAKNLSGYKLSKLIDYKDSSLYKMIAGKVAFPPHVIEKIAPILEVSVDEIKGWIVADKYSKEVIQLAIQAKKEKQDNDLILTTKIDEVLKSKNLSRTALSKQIKHSQSSLNCAITGKESFSKKLMHKISTALDIPETEIQSWVIADKYPLEVLEMAVNVKY